MRLFFLLFYNFVRIIFLKLFGGARFDVSWIQRISPFCALKLYEHGEMHIARNCQFEAGCDLQVHGDGELKIGQRVYMNRYSMVSAHGFIEIGDNCIFGPGVRIYDNNHCFDSVHGVKTGLSIGRVQIGKNCWIASNVVILKDTKIGDNCVIGAGRVVKGEIPSGSIVRPSTNNIIEPIRS